MRLLQWFTKRNEPEPRRNGVRILMLSRSESDCAVVQRVGNEQGWSVRFAASIEEAAPVVAREGFEVILCDRDQAEHPWREVLDRILAACPGARVLLLSPVNDTFLWREVVQRGGYDVLSTPLKEKSVIQIINSAKRLIPTCNRGTIEGKA